MKEWKASSLAVVGMLALVLSCSDNPVEKYHDVYEKIEAKQVDTSISMETADAAIDPDTVRAMGVERELFIPRRTSGLTSFPCSECHSEPLAELKAKGNAKKAHWNIHLKHAEAGTMNCLTCHNEKNFDVLHSLTDSAVVFDHSYRLCGQCHSDQFKDWKGGAHGKRLKGWTAPRISQTCVGCHNPHSPKLEKR